MNFFNNQNIYFRSSIRNSYTYANEDIKCKQSCATPHEIYLRSFNDGVEEIFCLVLGHRLDTLARLPLWEVGLDYLHGTGHGVGAFLNVHEGMTASPRMIIDVIDEVIFLLMTSFLWSLITPYIF